MTLGQLLSIVEIRTKLISVSTFVLATLYAAATGARIVPGVAALLAVAILCVDMGTTAFNSFFDYLRGVDNRHFTREPDKVLVHEGVAPGHALIVSLVLYLVAAGVGLAAAWLTTWWLVVAGVAGMLVGFLYNGGPRPISHSSFGELFAGGFLGGALFLVVVLAYRGSLDGAAILAAIPSTLVVAGVLSVNNACDVEGDRSAGRRTLAIVLGPRAGRGLVYAEGVAAFALLLAACGWQLLTPGRATPPWLPSLPAIGTPIVAVGLFVAVLLYVSMARRGFSHATKPQNMRTVLLVIVDFTVCYAAILVLALLGR